ncbi:MAG: transglycosylase domain-containing protein [Oscillibacter sp.]|nr:transglycosylase domain-containing protein [Oscillibacter sp.]
MRRKQPKRQRQAKKPGFFGYVAQAFLFLAALATIGAAGFVFWAVVTSPQLDLKQVAPQRYRTAMLDADGNVMRYLAGEEANREYVPLSRIPQTVRDAFVAIEDQRFYRHHGIDIRGIGRAVVEDIRTRSFSQGASTLTQQLIKNNMFAAGMEERTPLEKLTRKIQEQYLAVVLESLKDKDWILENYLNTIDLGGVWGVETASLKYFGRHVWSLSTAEAAAIAAITKNPSLYNPLRHEEDNRSRQRLILREMTEQGYLTEAERGEAEAEDVYAEIRRVAEEGGQVASVYSWFEDAALESVREDLERFGNYSPEECWELIYSGGLTIETTQDSEIQRICEENLKILQSDAQFTAVVIDPAKGAVRGIIGARGEKTVSRALNRAVASVRQPGSTLKILGAYAEALERGQITLGTVYDDRPTKYKTDRTTVKNSDGAYGGKMTVRRAIAHSVNTVALQCFQDVGMDAVWERLKLFGLEHLDESDRVEALALGGTHNGVTNLELTAAYAAVANEGIYMEPHFYERVLDQNGEVLLQKIPHSRRAVSRDTAALLTSAMEDVLISGTGRRASFPGQPLAGKTGTTTEQRDLWFVGYSPYYACGVWSGYDDNAAQNMNEVQSLWQEIMRGVHADLPAAAFALPDGMERRTICAKCGRLAVPGFCDATVQGDATYAELYAPGAAPATSCDCHVRVYVCPDSGLIANSLCPKVEVRVCLGEGTAGTADEAAKAPTEICTFHYDPWAWEAPPPEAPDAPETPAAPDSPGDAVPPWVAELWNDFKRHIGRNG